TYIYTWPNVLPLSTTNQSPKSFVPKGLKPLKYWLLISTFHIFCSTCFQLFIISDPLIVTFSLSAALNVILRFSLEPLFMCLIASLYTHSWTITVSHGKAIEATLTIVRKSEDVVANP